MSENTQDAFEPEKSSDQEDKAQIEDATTDQPNLPETEQAMTESIATENALPPEAQGEANGGPLGCCLGVMVGMLLSLSVAILSRLYADPLSKLFQNNYSLLGLLVRILMGILVLTFAILCGYFGWKLGKRFYREYEAPVVKQRKSRSKS